MRAIDLTGQSVGRWTVLDRAENSAAGGTMWRCRCACGVERTINGIVLRDARSKSCGCLKSEVTTARSTKHGHANTGALTPTYHSWVAMTQRCTNPKNAEYVNYGGRGIRICARWKTFANFLADMGEKPRGTSIERADNSRGYTKGNCHWSTPTEQARNKRNNRVISYAGRRQTMTEWANELGITPSSLAERIEEWPLKRAMTAPAHLPSERAKNVYVEFRGETHNLTTWARRLGISLPRLSARLALGWTVERAFTTPVRPIKPGTKPRQNHQNQS